MVRRGFWCGAVFGAVSLLCTSAGSRGGETTASSRQAATQSTTTASTETPGLKAGGLEALEAGWTTGQNLLVNADFSDGLNGWRYANYCFRLDPSTPGPNGKPSLRVDNPGSCGNGLPAAVNEYMAPAGRYSLGGQVKTKDLVGLSGVAGLRITLFWAGATPLLSGTNDWKKVTWEHATIPEGKQEPFRLEIYRKASGTAWFSDVYLRKETPPLLRTFLLYPNYRGYLFPDAEQKVRVAVTLNLSPDLIRKDLIFDLESVAGTTGTPVHHTYQAPDEKFTASIDFRGLPAGVYHLRGRLLDRSGKVIFAQTPYEIVKLASPPDKQLKAWIDDRNLAHFGDGKAHYVIGVYDTTGYSSLPSAYEKNIDEIAQAPINMIINYYIGAAQIPHVDAYTVALQAHGIYYLPTLNLYYEDKPSYPKGLARSLNASNQDELVANYTRALSSNRGIAGYYVQDEPQLGKLASTFHQYQVIKANDPAGFDLAVINRLTDLGDWKDAADVIGVDNYPIRLPPDVNLATVGDWTRAAVNATQGSRPVWAVIQFFQMYAHSSWPTEDQLYDMSWMAVAEGATGVFYWSHGNRGLGWVKEPERKVALWSELVHVSKSIKEMEPVLIQPDSQVLASKPSDNIVAKEKQLNGIRYVIAYNHGGDTTQATFALRSPAQTVHLRKGGSTIALDHGTSFHDTFAGYEAKVYEIR